jgi:hypothetical protein
VKLAAEQKAALEIAGAAKTTRRRPTNPKMPVTVQPPPKPRKRPKDEGKEEAEAPKAARKDKQGIFPDVTAGSPPLEVVS